MYESTFQLEKRPFVAVPSAEFYFPAESIETARVSLDRLIERDEGPAMVVGPVGIGKSMLSQLLAQSFRSRLRIALIPSARICTRRTLLQVILHQFGLPYQGLEEGELRLSLIDHVTSKDFCPHGALMLVDEADALPMLLIDELRTMTNIISAGESCVRLILFGSSRLEEKMAHPRLESLNQRLAGRFYIEPFDLEETVDYVTAHFEQCGGSPEDVFNEDALHTVYSATNGVPRLINQLCDHALILAAIDGQTSIDKDLVNEAWADLQQLPTPTFSRSQTPASESDFIEFGELDAEFDSLEDSVADRLEDIEHTVDGLHDDYDDAFEDDDRPTLRVHCEPVGDDEVDPLDVDPVPSPDLAENPFEEEFEEEFVVIGRPGVAELLANREARTVCCDRSENLASQLMELTPVQSAPVKTDDSADEDESFQPFDRFDDENQPEAMVPSNSTVHADLDDPHQEAISAEQQIIQQLAPIEMTDGYSIADDLEYSSDQSQVVEGNVGQQEDGRQPTTDSEEQMTLRASAAERNEGQSEPCEDTWSNVSTSSEAPSEQPLSADDLQLTEPIDDKESPVTNDVPRGSDENLVDDEKIVEQVAESSLSPKIVTNVEEVGYECQVEYRPIVVDVEQPIYAESAAVSATTTSGNDEELKRPADTSPLTRACAKESVDQPTGTRDSEKPPTQKFRRLFLKLKHAT